MNFVKIIPIKLYDTKLKFIISNDARKTINRIYKKHKTGMVYKDYIAGMFLTLSMNTYYIIIDNRHLDHNTIQHEQFHCVMEITFDRCVYEEEQRAWLMGFIGQEIYNFIKEKGIKVG